VRYPHSECSKNMGTLCHTPRNHKYKKCTIHNIHKCFLRSVLHATVPNISQNTSLMDHAIHGANIKWGNLTGNCFGHHWYNRQKILHFETCVIPNLFAHRHVTTSHYGA
jgi:hypothetical protein